MSVHVVKRESAGHESGGPMHEINTVRLTPILVFAAILVLVSVATFVTVSGMLYLFDVGLAKTEGTLSPLADPNPIPPEPRLQVTPGDELQRLRATEDEVLNSYRWVDKDGGVVGLPIDRAISLLAERGLPARGGGK